MSGQDVGRGTFSQRHGVLYDQENEIKNYFLGLYGRPPGSLNSTTKQKAIGKDKPVSGRPANNLDPELSQAKEELVEHNPSDDDVLSYTMFPSIALQFFDERERGELKPETLEPIHQGGPALVHDLHLAPIEFNMTLHGESYHVRVSGSGSTVEGWKPYFIKVDDKLEEVYIEPHQEVMASGPETPISSGTAKGGRPKPSGPGDVTTPMPGRVVKVLVTEGAKITKGSPMLVIEAMKMEHTIVAPANGIVEKVLFQEGDMVHNDAELVKLSIPE